MVLKCHLHFALLLPRCQLVRRIWDFCPMSVPSRQQVPWQDPERQLRRIAAEFAAWWSRLTRLIAGWNRYLAF
jgi:hypothetical protein